MHNLFQRTIRDSVSCTGIGLHTGEMVKLTLRPAPPDSGVTFVRTDLPGTPEIKACLENVIHTRLATTLGRNGAVVGTVEHILATLVGLGVDNVRVETDGPEIPIMDGSSGPFVYLLNSVGVKTLSAFKKFLVIRKPVSITDGDKSISVAPARELGVHYTISFDHPLLRSQHFDFQFSDAAFEREISRARTFGFQEDAEELKRNGFARGGSLANAIIIDRFRVLNQDGLRYEDEFIRHKVLDFLGDISLIGAPIIGRFQAVKSGHGLNNALLNQLIARPEAWELVEFTHPVECEARDIRVPAFSFLDAPRAAA
ncbi:MAG: UDP-3-O-acyl-N-acetylglucosamine deacetylase [Proteobacteria bacterium]|nr:UDP-3-O-acyl-N-acetylglucosamine deacetylase [Pseudomonadota bacterium]